MAFAKDCENVKGWRVASLEEDALLISLLRVNGRSVSPSLDVFPYQNTYLVPLLALDDLFQLGWEIDTVLPSVSSKYESNENNLCEFSLEFQSENVASGEIYYWAQDDFDVYIDIAFLPHILGGKIQYNFKLLQLNITTETVFPGLINKNGFDIPSFSARNEMLPDRVIGDKYHLLTLPTINYQVRGNYDSVTDETRLSGSVNSFFDIAKHSAELRVSGSDSDSKQFLKFSRNVDITGDNQALNYLRYEAGDIQLQSDELIYRSKQAFGVSVFNFDPKYSRSFSQVTIEEVILPGWRAQLFRNGQFIEETFTDGDNRVVFNQVDTFYGSNLFEIKLYGPEGQQEVREQTINIGSEQLSPGGLNYHFNVSDAGKRFIDSDDTPALYDQNISGLVSYGVSSNVTLEASVHSLSGLDQQQDYLSSALYMNFANSAVKTQLVKDLDAGNAFFAGVNSRFGSDLRANFTVRYFDDFVSDAYPDSFDLQAEAKLRLNGRLQWWEGVAWSSSITHRAFEERQDSNQISMSISKNLFGGTFSSSFDYDDARVDETFRNRIYWSKNIAGWQVSNSLEWLPADDLEIIRFNSNIRWPQKLNSYNESRIEYRPNLDDKFLLRHQFNWRQESFNLQFGSSITNGGEWTVNLGITGDIEYDPFNQKTSFYRPRGGSIANIHALAFLDNNRNSVFDDSDEALGDVIVKGNALWRESRTNSQGQIQLPTNVRNQAIHIDETSLSDPFMQPSDALVFVTTHRGGINTVALPVVTFNDIEGAIYRVKNDKSRGANGLEISIVDHLGTTVAKTVTEVDGYFFFTRVPPGQYSLQLEQDYLDQNRLSIANLPKSINAPNEGDSLRINDLLLVDSADLEVSDDKANRESNISQPIELDAAESKNSEFYVQLGAFKKPRSIIEVIQYLPTDEYDLKIFRNHNTGLSYVVMGSYDSMLEANLATRKIQHIKQFSFAYINSGDRYFSEGWSLEYELRGVAEHLNSSHQIIQQASTGSYFCQLASYRSLTSIGDEVLNAIQPIIIARRQVNTKRYYSLYTGPVFQKEGCSTPEVTKLTPDKPFAVLSETLKRQLVLEQ
jgi:hypothetical protein